MHKLKNSQFLEKEKNCVYCGMHYKAAHYKPTQTVRLYLASEYIL